MILNKGQVSKVKLALATKGIELPKNGWSVEIPEGERKSLQNALGTHYPPRRVFRMSGKLSLTFAMLIAFFVSGCAAILPPVQEGNEPRSGYPTGAEVNAIVEDCEKSHDEMGVALCVWNEIERKWPDTVKR